MVIVDTTVWIDYFRGVGTSETRWLYDSNFQDSQIDWRIAVGMQRRNGCYDRI
jgi:hypothetical protein